MKFSIRDLFLVTLIVALAVGWWVDRSKLAAELERLSMQESVRYFHQVFTSSAPAPNPTKP
jgi:hypothetical protein